MSLTLVIGGTRSGKSAHAERLASATGRTVRYVATADASDPSMHARIAAHIDQRPAEWETVQAGTELIAVLLGDGVSLIDGLGGWVAGVLHRQDGDIEREVDRLIDRIAAGAEVIVVAEEAGQGLLPMDRLSRAWLDHLGTAVQRLSAAAQVVHYVVAGRAIALDAGGALAGDSGTVLASDAPAGIDALRTHGDRMVRAGDVDHAVNVLDPGPPPWLAGALRAALDADAIRYPNEDAARAAIAALHGREPEEIVITNGAAEALWLLGPALRPRLAVCVHPGFTETEAGLRAHGIPVTRALRDPEARFALDPESIPDEADLVVVGNPVSPSGTLDPAAAILALRRPGRTVVVDEAFMGMVPGEPSSLAAETLDDVIVVRSLTKLLSIPGLRAGYAIAAPGPARRMIAARAPWSANALALTALLTAATHPAELAALADRAQDEREDLAARLEAIPGVRLWPSHTNYCLIAVADGPRVVAALREAGIAVRSAASFPGLTADHIRITARDADRNAVLAARLRACLSPEA